MKVKVKRIQRLFVAVVCQTAVAVADQPGKTYRIRLQISTLMPIWCCLCSKGEEWMGSRVNVQR